MSTPIPESPLSPEAEDALFRRLLKRLGEAGQSAISGAGNAASVVAEASGTAKARALSAAAAVGEAAGEAAGQAASYAKEAAHFVQKHPGLLAVGAVGPMAPVAIAAMTALTATHIVRNRKAKGEDVAQMLFRVPESLRDEVKRLAMDEKKQMDELLTEAVLDLLLKYGRSPKALELASAVSK